MLSIGEVAARTGLSVHVLRKYEREGLLLSPVRRDGAGRRLYDPVDVDWLRNCVRFRESDMPLSDIRCYVELVRAGNGTERERVAILQCHRTRLQDRRNAIEGALSLIDHKIALYEDHLESGASDAPWAEPVRVTD
jgi:DNA-binding transcriptional MerR regulator